MTNTLAPLTETIYVTAGSIEYGDQMNVKSVFPYTDDSGVIELIGRKLGPAHNIHLIWAFVSLGSPTAPLTSSHVLDDPMQVTRQVR